MESLTKQKTVLHVGCGLYHSSKLHEIFLSGEWKELRLDIDPAVNPNIIATMTDLSILETGTIDAIWSPKNLDHLFAHEVPMALKEFWRVIKDGGFLFVSVPDIQAVAEHIVKGEFEDPLFMSSAGPISAVDLIYGFRGAIEKGRYHTSHKTGFIADTLRRKLVHAGFKRVDIRRDHYTIWAIAYKGTPDKIFTLGETR